MKALKYILFLLLIAIIGISIYIAVQPNSYEVTRTATINAPSAVIYDKVIDFDTWNDWNSWLDDNHDIKTQLGETSQGVGGFYKWSEDGDEGSLTTVSADKPNFIEQKMQYADMPPADVKWTFEANADGTTKVTRTISGDNLPFMFKAYTAFSGGMEEEIGPHYERDFEKLDTIVTKSMSVYDIKVNGIVEHGGGFYMFKTTSTNPNNISTMIGKQLQEISDFMGKHNISQSGQPFTLYNEMNDNGNIIMTNAIPVQNRVTVTDDTNILCGYMEKTRALKVTLKGNYTNLGEAWDKAMNYLKDNELVASDQHPFEIYVSDPGEVSNPADWITEIYVPLQEEATELQSL